MSSSIFRRNYNGIRSTTAQIFQLIQNRPKYTKKKKKKKQNNNKNNNRNKLISSSKRTCAKLRKITFLRVIMLLYVHVLVPATQVRSWVAHRLFTGND